MKAQGVYGFLLHLYPYDYRTRFAAEMQATFSESVADHHKERWPEFICFLLIELAALIIGALAEWSAKLTSDPSSRGRSLPDMRFMRPPDIPREVWFAQLCVPGGNAPPTDPAETEKRRSFFVRKMVEFIARRQYEIARDYSYQERSEREKVTNLRQRKPD